MQAIIMAAGKGSRLGELTKDKPKSFVTIEEKRLIDYNIAILRKLGIKDINIVIGYMDESFRESFENNDDINLIYNPFYEFVNVLGSFYMGMDNLNDDFLYLHADTLCDLSVWEKMVESDGDIVLPYDPKPCDDEAMKLRLEDGIAVEINKTMNNVSAAGEFIGIAKINKNVIEELKNKTISLLRDKKYNEYFEAALQELMNDRKYDIKAISTEDAFWAEIDFIEDYNRAVENMSDNLRKLF